MTRDRFAVVPQWWLHALCLYGRLSTVERSVLDVFTLLQWGWKDRDRVSIGLTDLHGYLPGRSREGARRALAALATPATESVVHNKRSRPGHGMRTILREHDCRTRRVYCLQTVWRGWGWVEGTDLDRIASVLDVYFSPQEQSWSPTAQQAALLLLGHCRTDLGSAADVPVPQETDRVWRRWCETMQTILDRGHGLGTIEACVAGVAEDPFWASVIRGADADRKFARNLDGMIMRLAARKQPAWMHG